MHDHKVPQGPTSAAGVARGNWSSHMGLEVYTTPCKHASTHLRSSLVPPSATHSQCVMHHLCLSSRCCIDSKPLCSSTSQTQLADTERLSAGMNVLWQLPVRALLRQQQGCLVPKPHAPAGLVLKASVLLWATPPVTSASLGYHIPCNKVCKCGEVALHRLLGTRAAQTHTV